jgi:hypothetical protein
VLKKINIADSSLGLGAPQKKKKKSKPKRLRTEERTGGMAAAAAVAAAGRAVRYGVLSKALPTRLHINSGRGLDISEAEGPLDRYIQVLMVRTPLYRKPATLYAYFVLYIRSGLPQEEGD